MLTKKYSLVTITLLICLSFTEGVYSISAESGRQVETQNIVKQPSRTLDTIYALTIMKDENFPNKKKVIGSAIEYLKKSQNADGGWGLKKGDKSDSKITAKIIIGLWPFKDEYNLQDTLRKANDYILSLKNPGREKSRVSAHLWYNSQNRPESLSHQSLCLQSLQPSSLPPGTPVSKF